MGMEFTPVNIDEFFDSSTEKNDSIFKTGIVVFTDYQQHLINHLRQALAVNAPDRLDRLETRLAARECKSTI